MIVRVSEALLQPERAEAFTLRLTELVASFPAAHPGLIRHEVLVDAQDALKVQCVSWWRDEASLAAFAGQGWQADPVTSPDEEAFPQKPSALRHFVVSG